MKRIGNLYEQICSFENLYGAYLDARKNKRYRDEVLRFSAHLGENLIEIQRSLLNHTYKVGSYREFIITVPKRRLIMALPFRDRVVQWAIYRVINPLLDKQFISDSFACRKGKGSYVALERLQYWLRKCDRTGKLWYCLKMDISKYFYRVDHNVLMSILRRKIKDKELLELLETIIKSDAHNFGLSLDVSIASTDKEGRLANIGMPIGNLTSQMFANLYLNELDQFVKHSLHEHYYIRYMDDMLILGDSKEKLHWLKAEIECYLSKTLKLQLNNKTSIRPVKHGIEFVGFRVWSTHRKLRKSTMRRIKAGLKHWKKAYYERRANYDDINPSLQSYFGIMKQFNSYGLRLHISKTFILRRREIHDY